MVRHAVLGSGRSSDQLIDEDRLFVLREPEPAIARTARGREIELGGGYREDEAESASAADGVRRSCTMAP